MSTTHNENNVNQVTNTFKARIKSKAGVGDGCRSCQLRWCRVQAAALQKMAACDMALAGDVVSPCNERSCV